MRIQTSQTQNLYNSNKFVNQKRAVSLKSVPQFTGNKGLNSIEKKFAKFFVDLLETKPFKKLVEKTNSIKPTHDKNGKEIPFNNGLTGHLIVLGSTLLSGFYVAKTINNKDMDKEKRKTLAINQGLTWAVSTAMAYTFDNWAGPKFDKTIMKHFKQANKEMEKVDTEKFAALVSGMGLARTIITIDLVYRFIAPVVVTPFANAIGNKLHKNQVPKQATTKTNFSKQA